MLSSPLRTQAAATRRAVATRAPPSTTIHSLPRRRFASTNSGPTGAPSQSSSSSSLKVVRQLALVGSVGLAAYGIGSFFPPTLATYVSPRIAPPPPDPEHPHTIAYVEELESELQRLPVLHELRTADDAIDWYETRPYIDVPKEELVNSLTAGSLRGPGKLALPPLVRARKDEKASVVILHLGTALCGHEGIVHGGMLATLLDESLGRTALLNLPEKVGVTATLNLSYRAPTRANQFVVIKTFVDEQEGRKVRVSGRIEDIEGKVLVEAQALFVQPRYAKMLSSQRLHARLGRPLPDPSEPAVEGSLAPSPALAPAPPKAE
ncbi:HotDog domain-containing protein [Irpex lacteus]|nr:HotDog domain-containing protein [Irpex lacteus]